MAVLRSISSSCGAFSRLSGLMLLTSFEATSVQTYLIAIMLIGCNIYTPRLLGF